MPYLGNPPAERFTSLSKQTITGDGGTAYTLDFPVGSNQDVEVFVNNVRQEPSVAYTVSGTSLTMTGAVQSSDDFYVVFQGKAIGTVTHPAGDPLEATSGTFTGNVGIGTTSPSEELHLAASLPTIRLEDTDNNYYSHVYSQNADLILSSDQGNANSGSAMRFEVDTTERMRIDSSGNLLVGTTSTNPQSSSSNSGVQIGDGFIFAGRTGEVAIFNRQTTDGDIAVFRKNGTTVGSIGNENSIGVNSIYIVSALGTGITFGNVSVLPTDGNGNTTDNSRDLGATNVRFDDVYATNGTIQTSDRNEKQDIEALTDAEQRVAVAAKGLIRKFRWKSAVAEKGDDARIHFGIIAQDLQAAFEAEGLDAGRYAMFIYSEWWETTETYTDDDGVEQTRTNTYDSEDEAPEGAVKKSRMGVRYSELLAFIIAAI